MRKQVSSMFAIIVVLVAIGLGALYFLSNYRAHEARARAESELLSAQAEMARSMRGARMGGRSGPGVPAAPGRGAIGAPEGNAVRPPEGRTPPGQ